VTRNRALAEHDAGNEFVDSVATVLEQIEAVFSAALVKSPG